MYNENKVSNLFLIYFYVKLKYYDYKMLQSASVVQTIDRNYRRKINDFMRCKYL